MTQPVGLLFCRISARFPVGSKLRLILRSYSPDWNPMFLIRRNPLHKVCRPGRPALGPQLAPPSHAAVCLHPGWWTPRRGEEFQLTTIAHDFCNRCSDEGDHRPVVMRQAHVKVCKAVVIRSIILGPTTWGRGEVVAIDGYATNCVAKALVGVKVALQDLKLQRWAQPLEHHSTSLREGATKTYNLLICCQVADVNHGHICCKICNKVEMTLCQALIGTFGSLKQRGATKATCNLLDSEPRCAERILCCSNCCGRLCVSISKVATAAGWTELPRSANAVWLGANTGTLEVAHRTQNLLWPIRKGEGSATRCTFAQFATLISTVCWLTRVRWQVVADTVDTVRELALPLR
mmetsp:Transcript_138589/g.276310  ORF Transcript_138589/g.276310 Transcript_138589/m.276310 type:complete len:349 (+) Transcript_138589:426-1472(+)